VVQTPDGGFAIVGTSADGNVIVIRTNGSGDVCGGILTTQDSAMESVRLEKAVLLLPPLEQQLKATPAGSLKPIQWGTCSGPKITAATVSTM